VRDSFAEKAVFLPPQNSSPAFMGKEIASSKRIPIEVKNFISF
jgi:hypothetical protein